MARKKRKNRRPKNALTGVIISVFAENPFRAYNYKQIARLIGIKDKASKDLLMNILQELQTAGELVEVKTGKYMLNSDAVDDLAVKKKYITGTVDMKKTGKAYVISDEGGEDVFIAANNVNHALHDDLVKVFIFPKRKSHKTEGQVVEILERRKDTFVGRIEMTKNFGFVIADSDTMPYDILVPKSEAGQAQNGQKVLVRITDWPEHANNPFGQVVEVLGMPGENEVEMKSILAEYNFPLSFPKAVEKEAHQIKAGIEKELGKRRDFRDTWTITIDPADAKDFDDALSLKKLDDSSWEVGVHIADVSHYVRPGSLIEEEAFKRGTSVYLVDRVVPMLPEKLSNDVCSLRPDEEKLTFSAVFKLDENANVLDSWFGKTVILSDRRFAYEEVQEIIENGEGEFVENITVLNNLATILRDRRFKNGSINFGSEEVKFKLDENGKPLETYIKEQKEANHLIEEFMLLANKRVAETIGLPGKGKTAKTFVYRVHDEPNPEKLNTFVQFLKKLGYSLNVSSHQALARSYNTLFQQIHGKGVEHMIETIAIRTMAKAYYSTDNIGHYGLAFRHYSHFTSPIRRYPDLMAHRLLERYLAGKSSVKKDDIEEKCKHASDMERKAINAERDSVKYKQVEFLMDKVGQIFEGQISGVSKWGIFVELLESKAEGLIRFNNLKDDYYYFDEDNYRIIGKQYGNVYRLGDKVTVLVKKVNLEQKQLDFELVD